LEEIIAWSGYTIEQKLALLEAIERRRAAGRDGTRGAGS
jgi:hypothetical protein